MVFPIMGTNMWQCYRAGHFLKTVTRYRIFAIVLSLVLIVTTYFTSIISPDWSVALIGVIVLLFSLTNLFYRPNVIPDKLDASAQAVCGIAAGVIGGFTAVWSPPIAIYLLARNVGKDEFVRATGFLFLVGSTPLCIGFFITD